MGIEMAGFTWSLLAGMMAAILMVYSIDKKSKELYVASLAFVLASWSGLEWGLWMLGQDMFQLVYRPIVPMAFFFLVWTGFVIYTSEKVFKERRYWVAFLALIIFISIVARFCMDCL
ncbi:MAG: hypothetical protein ACE5J7_01165 [Candidatus Aenigmatarchaeota archaeon]